MALGAVRLLGADVLAPYLLNQHTLPPEETDAIGLALTALPPVDPPPPTPPEGPEPPWVRAWIDWGLISVLASVSALKTVPPVPPGPPRCDDGESHYHPPTVDGHPNGQPWEGWAPWSQRMGNLASLALPGLDGPVHDAARSGALGLARGATRALLRRDFPSAARITRWLAWLSADGVALPLDPVPLIQHIGLLAAGHRVELDIALACRLLDLEPA